MEELACTENEVITPEGELDSNMYIIRSGEAAVVWNHGGTRHRLMTLRRGSCYGEQVLAAREGMRKLKRKMSVEALPGASPIVMLVLTPTVVEELSSLDWFQSWSTKLGLHITETAVAGVDAVVVHKLSMVAKLGEEGLGARVSMRSAANNMHASCLKAASVLLSSHGHHADKSKEGKAKDGKEPQRSRNSSGELSDGDERKGRGQSSKGSANRARSAKGGGAQAGAKGASKGGAKGTAKGAAKRRKSLLESFADTIMGRSDAQLEETAATVLSSSTESQAPKPDR